MDKSQKDIQAVLSKVSISVEQQSTEASLLSKVAAGPRYSLVKLPFWGSEIRDEDVNFEWPT